jgi:Thymidylate synthase complementing protein
MVELTRTDNAHAEAVATLLYPVTRTPFRDLYEIAISWSSSRRDEVIDVALRSRSNRDDLLKAFRGGPYAFDIVMDIGAYRDIHRHRRCQQYHQAFSGQLGFDTPEVMREAGIAEHYEAAMQSAFEAMKKLPSPAAHYLLPFGARSRFLFKMDFAEADYIARLRSGVKGHFSYRKVAWEMKEKMQALEPELGRLMSATPPWVDDPLKR